MRQSCWWNIWKCANSANRMPFSIFPIGKIFRQDGKVFARLFPAYAQGLVGLCAYSHLQLLWWFSGADDAQSRGRVQARCPYLGAPKELGVFATRSPHRPNPIALTCCRILAVDAAAGLVQLEDCDAEDGSPILDIKPYAPSSDRVEHPSGPAWSAHWPGSLEESAAYDWAREMDPSFEEK